MITNIMQQTIITRCESAIIVVELSNIDAHKKANIKSILASIIYMCQQCIADDSKCTQCKFKLMSEKHG